MYRIVQFAQKYHLRIQLAYYPPYHSKYNPVERTFGWLERHWLGSLLDEVETVLRFAETLNFKGNHPVVTLIKQGYQTGVKLRKQAMAQVERQLQRLPNLPKWFVEISDKSPYYWIILCLEVSYEIEDASYPLRVTRVRHRRDVYQ